MHQLLPIQQAAAFLGYKDKRSAVEWCKSNGVTVRTDKKRKYVFKSEIEFALEQDYIMGLVQKYPDNYEEMYNSIKNNDMLEAFKISNNQNTIIKNTSGARYIPKGKFAKKFNEKHLNK